MISKPILFLWSSMLITLTSSLLPRSTLFPVKLSHYFTPVSTLSFTFHLGGVDEPIDSQSDIHKSPELRDIGDSA